MLTNSFCDVATSLPIREASADRREPSNDSKSIAHVPLDEGWAWVVLIGALYVSVTLLGIGMSFGIIFSDPLIAMGSSSTLNAWIFNFHYFMWHCSTVFSGALCSSFGWRPVSFIGYGVTSISFMLMTFVTTPLHIFMLFSIIVGIAGGLSTTVVLLIVPAYFDKYKGGALSSLSVGVAMSMFIIPPLIRFLIDEYSFKGACLIFGAILLNCCVGALLFRPLNCNSDGTILTANSDLNDSVKSAKWRRILPVLKTSLNNLKHLKQLRLLIITLSFSTFMMTYGNFSGQFPFAMIERGYSTSYAPWCISLSAITSTFVRIIVTLVSDRKWFSRKYGYISGLVISGLSTSVVYLVINNLSMVLVAMVFWGAGTALVLSTYFALIIDICGRELYTPGVSATGLFLGTLSLIIGPFFGVAPVFPFMMVIALQLGAPVVVMGAVNALFLCMIVLLKPLIAACADSFPRYRKHVFISNLIICITAFASVGLLSPFTDDSLAIYARIANETTAAISAPEAFDKKYFENFRNTSFMLSTPSVELNAPVVKSSSCCRILSCDGATSQQHSQNDLQTCLKLSLVSYLLYEKNSTIFNSSISFIKSNSVESILDPSGSMLVSLLYELQLPLAELNGLENVRLDCKEDVTNSTTLSSTLESFNHHIVDQDSSLYQSQLTSSTSVPCSHNEASSNSSVWLIPQFYLFCILMLTATLCYSTTNSITDAICIDSIGVDGDYGSQRAWGSVSWSLVGLTTGFLVDWCSDGAVKDYTPAFLLTLLLGTIDIAIASLTLKVPRLEYKPAVWENVKPLMRQRHVTFFLLFVIMNGCMDGIVANYIFVLQEEIAEGSPAMANIKLLQGLTLLVQGGTEIPAMFLCDRLTKKYGADRLTTIVFGAYAVRLITLGVTALTGHPWLTLLAESLNGPCYGLGYTAIVIYTGHISTPGTSATIQSVVNICYEAIGYGLSSLIGGALFRSVGGAYNYLIFGVVSLITCPLHYLFTKYYPTSRKDSHVKTAEEDSTEATPMQLTQSDKN